MREIIEELTVMLFKTMADNEVNDSNGYGL